MKVKLIEYPFGKDLNIDQDVVWFIQGTCDNRKWDNYMYNYPRRQQYEELPPWDYPGRPDLFHHTD